MLSSFTLSGGNYREIFTADKVSASAVNISFGELSDAFAASAIYADTLSFSGGDGALFSADITDVVLTGGSDWSITIGNGQGGKGLAIDNLQFSASGVVTGTVQVDTISASSTST